jgi:two-component system OmpR family response regulator
VSANRGSERVCLLLIEDEPGIAQEIIMHLGSCGFLVRHAESGDVGLEAARHDSAALLIVDRMLSGVDSLPFIETLRREGIRIPVLFLSALASVDDRIHGLKAGGDDYLTKPFAMDELTARVEALLRRSAGSQSTLLRVGPLEMDLVGRTVRRGERALDLLPREFKLLEYLMRHPGETVTRAMLLENVWHYNFPVQTNLVDVHLGKLRRKIDGPEEPTLIQSIRGVGFVLQTGH